MKRITNDEYLILLEILGDKIEEIYRHSYSKYANKDMIQKDINILKTLEEKVSERVREWKIIEW